MCDWPEFWSIRRVYGRKAYRCVECRREIARGEFHEVETGKWDGQVRSYRTCIHCTLLVRWLGRVNDEGYEVGGALWEIEEYLRDGYGGLDVARAFATARRMRWRSSRTGRLLPVPPRLAVPPPPPWERPRRRRCRDFDFTDEGWARFDCYLERAS